MPRLRPFIAILGFLVSIPAFAGSKDCGDISITSLTANDVQLQQLATIHWSYSGATPVSQQMSISWAGHSVLASVEDRSYSYLATRAGTYQVKLTAQSECGTAEATTHFFVKNCFVPVPVIQLSDTAVDPGEVVTATVDVPPDHTAEWFVVRGGTLAVSGGGIAGFIAGTEGPLEIQVVLTNDKGCTETGSASVEIIQPPPPPSYCHPYVPSAGEIFYGACPDQVAAEHLLEPVPEGATVVWSVDKGEILSGQGTSRITYVVHGVPDERYTLASYLLFPDGCKSEPYDKSLPMHGAPETSISLSTSSIHAGESTTIYLTTSYVSGGNFYAENGDSIEPIYSDTPQICCKNNVYPYKYTSLNGAGVSTIRSFVTGMCGGTAEASTTLEILP